MVRVIDGRLVDTFVELADTLTDDFDVIDFLHLLSARSVELLSVDAAGLLLADAHGELQLVASSNEQVRLLELFQLQRDEGPCLDAFRLRQSVTISDLSADPGKWPSFATVALDQGFRAVHAFPMRLRSEVIGALNLFSTGPGELAAEDARVARGMVDVATIGLLQARTIHRHEVLVEQLQTALSSRVVIEQAKGFIAERLGLAMDEAFSLLRHFARSHSRKLSLVAADVVNRAETVRELFDNPPTR
ncbi:GAF and ANTAR domain-containing protein [Amycolatopsis sp. FDAARGOS 1241]|uniref:GAF and ANTAR domain-containing protein n=1 Tax=Amycolatopsis sp. FDAARGOS 1241 TaxID=2778070 RepID=UPI001950531B|nr:GAF and ANTAR domain-containing protein [Amycolatopsis sp. FDAARGOS 1241]QRP46742.1 GAF and ANTAR domain-containing protein [Amycolatopsis sp. FDAARGOS 1241]